MIGIHTGGAWLAERLHQLLAIREPLGTLDIAFYRDDFTRIGMNPLVRPSHLPVSVDNQHIILVDDVVQTGRTIRAALKRDIRLWAPRFSIVGDPGGAQWPGAAHRTGCGRHPPRSKTSAPYYVDRT